MNAIAKPPRAVPMEVIGRYARQAPVDLEAMAEELDVRVVYDRTLPSGISGKIQREGDRFAVTINANHSPGRQRFTLAHELAHLILHADLIGAGVTDDAMYRSTALSDETERQADAFAAELIMPAQMVRQLFHKEGVKSIAGMAQRFDVSHDAAKVRMKWLRLG